MFRNKKIHGSDPGGYGAEEDEISIERILAAGLDRGLRMQDTELLSIGMWIDYIIEWNNIRIDEKTRMDDKAGKPKEKRRKATQADFDVF